MWWTVWPASSCVVCLRLRAGEDSLLTMPMDADHKKPCRKPILCSQKKKKKTEQQEHSVEIATLHCSQTSGNILAANWLPVHLC